VAPLPASVVLDFNPGSEAEFAFVDFDAGFFAFGGFAACLA
jgi:hypothetical protein